MNWPIWLPYALLASGFVAVAALAWWLLGLFEGDDNELPPDNFEYCNPQDWGDQ